MKMKRILMTLMGLEIGGVETHVVELARQMKRMGYEVIIASNGGVFEKELAEEGIRHYHAPLHTKKPSALRKSYRILKRILREERIDLIHAHARIPAMVCGWLHRRTKIPFVTSAHWVFKAGFPYNLLTDWGQKTVAVSEDIKQYLIKNYRLPEKDIIVTINGIDTEKFSSGADTEGIVKEFSLGGTTRIVYCSRMDTDRAAVAFQLVALAPRLAKEIDGLEIVVVGGGNEYDRLVTLAEQVNGEIGRRVVVTTGARTDVNRFVAAADLFIGVSRAALEAMAAEKPVIVAGNEGYLGLFDREKFPTAVESNFTCRGCPMPEEERLYEDIIRFFEKTEEERRELGSYGKEIIETHYSVARMASDTEKAYLPFLGRKQDGKSDFLISGYYGFHNNGDDALLSAMLQALREKEPSARITVLSAAPKETKEIYGVRSVYRYNPISLIREMRRCRVFISGGGSLIQDVTSTKSAFYYLMLLRMASMFGKKIMLYANGIGPLRRERNRRMAAKILNRADIITLREEDSLAELEKLGVTRPERLVTADPAFALPVEEKRAEAVPYAIYSLRSWQAAKADFAEVIAAEAQRLYKEKGWMPVFLPMQYQRDLPITKAVAERLSIPYRILPEEEPNATLLGIIAGAELVVAMRLHTLIYAARSGVRSVALIYDPKVRSFMESIGRPYMTEVGTLTKEKLAGAVEKSLADERHPSPEEMRQKALQNADIAIQLLKEVTS